jgi:hypothetical protein
VWPLFVVAITGVVEGIVTAHDIAWRKTVNLLRAAAGRLPTSCCRID